MKTLTIKDFDGLTVPQFAEKLQQTNDMDLLNELEALEEKDLKRKGVFSAINERQGELIDELVDEQSKQPYAHAEKEEVKSTENFGPSPHIPAPPAPPAPEPNAPEENSPKTYDEGSGTVDNAEDLVDKGLEEKGDVVKSREDFIAEIKEKRVQLDRIFEFCKAHFRIDSSPEKPLFLSRAWLGKMLGALDAPNPYAGENKIEDRSQIPVAADKNESTHFAAERHQFTLKDTFKAVIELRSMLEELIKWIDELDVHEYGRNAAICRTQAYIRAVEAKFALGEILGKQKV